MKIIQLLQFGEVIIRFARSRLHEIPGFADPYMIIFLCLFRSFLYILVACSLGHGHNSACHEMDELKSSTSLPGGNQVDGLPPVSSLLSPKY